MTTQNTQLDKSKLTRLRTTAGMTDILKMLERNTHQGEDRSDITNHANTMSDTKDSFEDLSESIKLLNDAIVESESAIASIQSILQSILFTSEGKIDREGVESVVDYAQRLKNQMAGGENVQNLDRLNTLRVQFHRAFVWAKKKNYIADNERLSLKGVDRQLNDAFKDWFVNLDDKDFEFLSNQRKEFQGKFGKDAEKVTVSKSKGKGKKGKK